jgi:hypothetical protein
MSAQPAEKITPLKTRQDLEVMVTVSKTGDRMIFAKKQREKFSPPG